jgi:hypothetical protein
MRVHHRRSGRRRTALLTALALSIALVGVPPAFAAGLVVQDLTDAGVTPTLLASQLVGSGVSVVPGSVQYTGADGAAGVFTGGAGIVGIDEGIILSSGGAKGVVGPNDESGFTVVNNTPGLPGLDQIAGVSTYDAAYLDFQFEVPAGVTEVSFSYVFGSEEYNDFVNQPGTGVNDSFAFWVNGSNCALVGDPAVPVTINTINNGDPYGVAPINPHLFINNDPFDPDSTGNTVPSAALRDTQMDGLTVVLTCLAPVTPGANSIRLAIADGGDSVLDSWVLLGAQSLTITPVPTTLTLTPSTADKAVGQEHCVTATLTDQAGSPMGDQSVSFSRTGTHADSGTATTASNGTAQHCYTGTQAGSDGIVASVGTLQSNNASVNWSATQPEPVATSLSLTPPTASRTVGQQHCLTATVLDQFGNVFPETGREVTFTIVGTHAGTPTATTTAGVAEHCYSGTADGTDTAVASSAGVTPSAPAAVTWTTEAQPPVATTLTLSPPTATLTVGQQHCVTATLLDQHGDPMGGQSVTFTRTGANSGTASVQTDLAGLAQHCYTGTAAGSDSIVATVGALSSAAASVLWEQLPPPPTGDCHDLIAGQHHLAGEVCITNDGTSLTVTYTTTGGWSLAATHLAVSKDAPGSGAWTAKKWQNKAGNPAPGQFPHKGAHPNGTATVTYSVPIASLAATAGTGLFVAAHADVVRVVDGVAQKEGAWAAGDRFVPKGSWATYTRYTVR